MSTDQSALTIIFPHLPKCAGTSLLHQFNTANLKMFVDYDVPPHPTNKFFQNGCERRNRECKLLDFGNFDLVYGHFPISRYSQSSYRYVVLLRDPLERAISHFNFWKNLPASNYLAIHRNPIITRIQNSEVSFLEFIQQQKLSDYYSRFLCGKKPSSFHLVGFLDDYQDFVSKLSHLLGIDISPDVRLRQGMTEELSCLDEAKRLLSPDYSIYQQFRDHWIV
jgi:hypothetical protein